MAGSRSIDAMLLCYVMMQLEVYVIFSGLYFLVTFFNVVIIIFGGGGSWSD